MQKILSSFYKKLYRYFGPQHWWPAKSPFEVMVGAILTQNTSWQNVEKAIANLKKKKALSAKKLQALKEPELAALIKPSGFYHLKARRLKIFLEFFFSRHQGNAKKMSAGDTYDLRNALLMVKGIGPETADSILLYALNKPVFVVDAYTKRILLRHKLIKADATYGEVQNLFMRNLKNQPELFNEYHALLVRLAKDFCSKRRPRCEECPLG
ncbi:MAG: endonuclease III domain-containing protein [Candidatus Omnitrophica bacterium]|nr:endonuclease III domain-containing protein [Candidatus Omnitrophota bacterium]MDD5652601.1 endonuclease III domain-containing protein [Candidatus Omnitrophota bacterium]